jgi:hypothetical protein
MTVGGHTQSDVTRAVLRGVTSSPRWEAPIKILCIRGAFYSPRTSRLTPRSRMLVAVFTVAVLMIPSAPGWTLITRPKGHYIDGTLSSLKITMVLSQMPWLPLFHLLPLVNSLRYSRYHLLQKCCLILWMRCQLDNRPVGTVLKSRSRKLDVSPIKKWPGVRTGRCNLWFRGE